MGDGLHCQLWAFGEPQFTWISFSDGSNEGSKVDYLWDPLLILKFSESVDAEGACACVLTTLWDTTLAVICGILVEGKV